MELPDFLPGTGTPVPGIVSGSDERHFLANVPVAQLLSIAPDPRLAENPKFHALDSRLAEAQELRVDIQRVFEAAKKRNVTPYTRYLVELSAHPDFGVAQPIRLYCREQLNIAKSGGMQVLVIPFGLAMVAFDGETELASWHEAARQTPSVNGFHVDVTIDHGKPIQWAKQAFHDTNVFGIKPNPTLSIFMDYRDPVNRIAKEIAARFFPGKVEEQRRQAASRSDKLFTMAALRLFVVCFAGGTAGVGNATRHMAVEDDDSLEVGARRWMDELLKALPGEGLNSRESIFTTPPMLAALGAMGRDNLSVNTLRDLEWRRDALNDDGDLVWAEIAGKQGRKLVNDRPTLAVGGPKEYVHSCYRALVKSSEPEYGRVRKGAGVAIRS
jgi:DNA sulfur modification protein DndB